MNWLDITFLALILLCLILGIIRGFVRQLVGIAAVLAGLVLAVVYYKGTGEIIDSVIHNQFFSYFLGFILIFVLVIAGGWLIGVLLTRLMKGPLAVMNRALGGFFGVVKGVLICGILVFALLTFKVARPALETSTLAPACFSAISAAVRLIPQEVRDMFESSYREIRGDGGGHGKKI